MTARVPAKVNLQLSVGPPGADGYHDLVTVFHALALFDEVTVTSANTDSVVVTGEGARSVPLGPDNLAARAVAALVDAVGPGVRDSPGLAIEIRRDDRVLYDSPLEEIGFELVVPCRAVSRQGPTNCPAIIIAVDDRNYLQT